MAGVAVHLVNACCQSRAYYSRLHCACDSRLAAVCVPCICVCMLSVLCLLLCCACICFMQSGLLFASRFCLFMYKRDNAFDNGLTFCIALSNISREYSRSTRISSCICPRHYSLSFIACCNSNKAIERAVR